jgi:hypothetical protein
MAKHAGLARWIYDESPPLGPQDDLAGIIHSVSSPARSGEFVEFEVDFGSAPLAAFEELVGERSGCLHSVEGEV